MSTRECLICPATSGDAVAAGWTGCTLVEPVTYRSTFGGGLPPTPAGRYDICPACSAWLTDHRDRPLPDAVQEGIAKMAGSVDLTAPTARRLRMELVGIVRHLADAVTAAPR